MRPLAFLPVLALLAAAPPAAVAQDAGLQYFLHAVGECSGDGPELFLDQENSAGDAHGCGAVGLAGVAGLAGQGEGFTVNYPGKQAVGGSLASGTKAVMHIFVSTENPDEFNVLGELTIGNATCSGDSGNKQSLTQNYVDFAIPCELDGAVRGPDLPDLTVTIKSKAMYFIGYEGSAASRIDFEAAAAAEPTENATNGTEPANGGKGSPSPAVPVVLAALFAAAVVWTRRRNL